MLIAGHNAVQFLEEAISSALNQTYPRIEVVVVDDGSTDGSAEVIRRFGNSIRTLRTSNSGPAKTRNRALELATGELVAILDHDDVWHPDRLALCVEALQRSDRIGFVTTDAFLIDERGTPSGQTFYSGPRQFPPDRFPEALLRGNYVYASAVIWRQLVLQCGGFDPSAPLGCDDYDLWLKAVLRGAIPAIVPEPLASYRIHGQNLSLESARMELGRLALLERHLPSFWRQGVYGSGHDAWLIGTRLVDQGNRARAARFFIAAARSPEKSIWRRFKTLAALPAALAASPTAGTSAAATL